MKMEASTQDSCPSSGELRLWAEACNEPLIRASRQKHEKKKKMKCLVDKKQLVVIITTTSRMKQKPLSVRFVHNEKSITYVRKSGFRA